MSAKSTNPYEYDLLGTIVRSARKAAGLTIEELAAQTDISVRYLYRIENERQKPRYEILYRLIRTLHISPDIIFYPEKYIQNANPNNLICALYHCEKTFSESKSARELIATLEKE